MENNGVVIEPMDDLLPGFRFHPTDEELITHYLIPKIMDVTFSAPAIGEVDLNKCEPWDLPKRAKMGEKELYFFSVRDRKYPSGLRTNRATEAGYWKATGKDKEICRGKSLVGMKKTLVFYKGRAPKGFKSNWVMHEFRQSTLSSHAQNEWVICRIFHKSSSGKKIPFQDLITRLDTLSNDFNETRKLPPLMEAAASPYNANIGAPHHVSCFSTSMEIPQTSHYQTSFDGSINNNNNFSFSTNPNYYPLQRGEYSEQNISSAMIDNNGAELKTEVRNYNASQDYDWASSTRFDAPSGPSTSTSAGPVDLASLLNFSRI